VTVRICRIHDPNDVVPGRICGRPLPCRDHQPRARQNRRAAGWRVGVELTISSAAMAVLDRLAVSAGSRSAAVEGWLLSLPPPE
jgi:hypothetical protein